MRVYAHVDRGRRTPNLRNLALILLIGLATPGLGIQAQDAVWLKGQAVAVTPEFEPEDQPITFKKAPTATFSVGGETLVTCLAYSPDGKTLAVGDGPSHPVCTLGAPPPINENGGLIRLIDTSTHRVRMTLRRRKFPEHEAGHSSSRRGGRAVGKTTDCVRSSSPVSRPGTLPRGESATASSGRKNLPARLSRRSPPTADRW